MTMKGQGQEFALAIETTQVSIGSSSAMTEGLRKIS
jgi:hypothetical protein